MTEANNIINILQPYLKKIENAYMLVGSSDDIDRKKCVYAVGEGGIIITVLKNDASLTIQVFEQMSLENVEDYLTDRSLSGSWKGFPHKSPEEVREILDKLCEFLLETPADSIDGKILMQKVKEIEFDYYRKHPPISEHTMQRIRSEAERAELNMSLNKG